jgi:hypothetical protein
MTKALQINSAEGGWHPSYARQVTIARGSRDAKAFEVFIRRLPEGPFLATSPDIPGLILECEHLSELEQEIFAWAPELARDNGVLGTGETATIVMIRADPL